MFWFGFGLCLGVIQTKHYLIIKTKTNELTEKIWWNIISGYAIDWITKILTSQKKTEIENKKQLINNLEKFLENFFFHKKRFNRKTSSTKINQ